MSEAQSDSKARQFFHAAEPLLQQYGFRKTTVEEICRAAGASKRTFYELFRDKSDLLLQMLITLATDALEEGRAAASPDASAVERIDEYIRGYEAFARAHPVFAQCMHEAEFYGCPNKAGVHDQMRFIISALSEIIEDGIASGEFRQMDAPTVARIIDGLLDSMYYVLPQTTGEKSALENRPLARELRAFILNGLRNPEHH